MKRTLTLCLSLAALAVAALPLSAAEMTGMISHLDNEEDVFSLDGGPTFYLSEDASLKGLKKGQTVSVTYEEQEQIKIAIKIVPVKTDAK
tara:strand:+ start:1431 stop:1700 length:270 start_codon:yes stop_codon:yes gene_type:complete